MPEKLRKRSSVPSDPRPMIGLPRPFRLLPILLLWGCEGSQPADEEPSTEGELPLWTLEEDLRIGHEGESTTALVAVRDLAVSVGGQIAVLSSLEGQVRIFDPEGDFVRFIGSRGQGPGEIRDREYRVGAIADTFWIAEQRWVHTYDPAGRALDSRPLLMEPDPTAPFHPTEIVRLHGGHHAVLLFSWDPPAGGPPGRTVVLAPGGGETFSFDHPAPDPPRTVLLFEGGRGPESVPISNGFEPSAYPAFHPGGRFVVRVDEDRPSAPGPHEVRLTLLAPSGEVLRAATLPFEARSVPPSEVERRRRREARRIGSFFGGEEAAFERFRREVPVPDYFLEVHAVHATDAGGLWIAPQGVPGTPWLVLDPDLVPQARVQPPDGVTLRRVGDEAAWGVAYDALGVPTVVRYRIVRP